MKAGRFQSNHVIFSLHKTTSRPPGSKFFCTGFQTLESLLARWVDYVDCRTWSSLIPHQRLLRAPAVRTVHIAPHQKAAVSTNHCEEILSMNHECIGFFATQEMLCINA